MLSGDGPELRQENGTMRSCGLTLAGLLWFCSHATAQLPNNSAQPMPMQPAPALTEERLDMYLQAWEAKLAGVQTIVADCTRTELNKTFGTKEEFTGTARLVRPNLFKLDLFKKGDPQNFERYVCTGMNLYEYRPKEKLVRVYELPKNAQGQAVLDDTYLALLYGMKAADAKKRFGLKLVKEDQWWIYISIEPKNPTDKLEFVRGQMVFYAGPPAVAMMPRRIWLEHPNGDEVTWEFPKIESNVKLERTEFVAPAAPQGWKVVRADKPQPNEPRPPVPVGNPMGIELKQPMGQLQPPRVVRPQN